MKNLKKCNAGHYYDEHLFDCPYCKPDEKVASNRNEILNKKKIIIPIGKAPDRLNIYLEINHYDFSVIMMNIKP